MNVEPLSKTHLDVPPKYPLAVLTEDILIL